MIKLMLLVWYFMCRIKMSNETVINVDELQELAKQSLPKLYYDYYASFVDRGTDVFKALVHATQALLVINLLHISHCI